MAQGTGRQSGKDSKRGGNGKGGRKGLARLCSVLSMLVLAALVLACIPLTVPRMFGCQIYSVISGSMEPAIPVGSLVYVQSAAPEEILAEDVIAFYAASDSAAVITHRVTENRVTMGEFITKGDANQSEDMNPVPYDNFIGKVAYSIPVAGRAAELLTSAAGKLLAGGVILFALFLQAAAAFAGRRQD